MVSNRPAKESQKNGGHISIPNGRICLVGNTHLLQIGFHKDGQNSIIVESLHIHGNANVLSNRMKENTTGSVTNF